MIHDEYDLSKPNFKNQPSETGASPRAKIREPQITWRAAHETFGAPKKKPYPQPTPNPQYAEEDLLDRVAAAKYLGGFKPRTLSVWDCTKRYDLQPIKVGRKAVRYRRSSLDKFLKEYMSP